MIFVLGLEVTAPLPKNEHRDAAAVLGTGEPQSTYD